MQLSNICTKKEYEVNGEKKVLWFKVGVLKTAESGRKYINLYMHPEVEYFVFEPKAQSEMLSESEIL